MSFNLREIFGKAVDKALSPWPARFIDVQGDVVNHHPLSPENVFAQRRVLSFLSAASSVAFIQAANGQDSNFALSLLLLAVIECMWGVAGAAARRDIFIDTKPDENSVTLLSEKLRKQFENNKKTSIKYFFGVCAVGVPLSYLSPDLVGPTVAYILTEKLSIHWRARQVLDKNWHIIESLPETKPKKAGQLSVEPAG